MSVTKHRPLPIAYNKRIIFAGDDQALEDLPPEGLELGNRTNHIFIPVQAAYNGVDFEPEGRETDDEAMFEKRYEEYVQENGVIISQYTGRGLLFEIGIDMGGGGVAGGTLQKTRQK